MANYNIYVGMINEEHYVGTLRDVTEDGALDYAYELAVEEYESYAGYHGIPSWNECREGIYDLYRQEIEMEEYSEEDIDFMTNEQYQEEIASWVTYRVHEESSDKDFYMNYNDKCKSFLN